MSAPSLFPPDHAPLHEALRRAAALRDSFRPIEVLQAVQTADGAEAPPQDVVIMAEALSALQADCIIETGPTGPVWSLRPAVRRKVLGSGAGQGETLAKDAALDDALARTEGPVVEALRGTGAFAPNALQTALAEQEPSVTLSHLVGTLDRAGPRAPGYPNLIALRSALNTAEQRDRAEAILSRGFFGRHGERAKLAEWIAAAQSAAPLRSLHISGLPGIGKSFLLEKIIQEALGRDDPILIRLDFDRSGLTVEDTHAFFDEISRQLGDALPLAAAELRAQRLQSARERTALSGREARFFLPRDLLDRMGRITAADGRVVLIVLDTLEVLRARGETAVMTLFEHLDRLVSFGMGRVAVISAGRGDALEPVPDRLGGRLDLQGLEAEAEEALLAARGVPPDQWPAIRRVAQGNPLLLALAARAFAVGQGEAVLDGIQSRDPAVMGGYLYRAILSRLPQPLNDLAHAGLVLRRLDPGVLGKVLAPTLGLELDQTRALALFGDLSSQHWLMEADDRPGWLRHRTDMRAAFFPLLLADRPDLVRVISERAAIFDDLPPVDRLYHQLQLSRWGGKMPAVPADMANEITPGMLEELPAPARDAVLQAKGMRSGFGRAGRADDAPGAAEPAPTTTTAAKRRPSRGSRDGAKMFFYNATRGRLERRSVVRSGQIDERAIRDLQLMLANGDQREAGYILANSFDAGFDAASPAGRAVMCYLWLSGQWAGAQRLWIAMGKPQGGESAAATPSDPVLARICDEILAEYSFAAAVKSLSDRPMSPEPGRIALIGGALDVAGVTVHGRPDFGAKVAPPQGAEYAAGLLAPWTEDGDPSAMARLRAEAEKRRERFGLMGAGPDLAGWLVAPMMPHIAPLAALCLERTDSPRARWLAQLRPHLPELIALQRQWVTDQSSGILRVGDGVNDMVDALGVLGLTADWAGAMALSARDGDLRAIAASAERWRRLSHGQWPFARRTPIGWTNRESVDQEVAFLHKGLMARGDDGAGAARLLWLWSGAKDGPALRLLREYLRALLSQKTSAGAALALALDIGLSPGLAAPLAVLATLPPERAAAQTSFLNGEI